MPTQQIIDHEQFCELLDQATQVVDLSDGGQLACLADGNVAHFSAMTGQGCLISLL